MLHSVRTVDFLLGPYNNSAHQESLRIKQNLLVTNFFVTPRANRRAKLKNVKFGTKPVSEMVPTAKTTARRIDLGFMNGIVKVVPISPASRLFHAKLNSVLVIIVLRINRPAPGYIFASVL